MLEKLDTLIAFAVVMLGVSLMITILTQIIATFLALRGSNLLWGIKTLIGELAPGLDHTGLSPEALAKEILQHPLISDSSFSQVGRMWLVGAAVNFLSNHRPSSWVIGRWRYATAIRPEELVRMLQEKVACLPPAHAALPVLKALLAAPDPEAARKLAMLNAALQLIGPAAAGGIAVPRYAVQIDRIFQQATDAAQKPVGNLDTWFRSSMDRVAQRFVVQIRIWTVLFAFLLAFGAHFDSLRLLDRLSTSPETRRALVDMRDRMMAQAQAVLPSTEAIVSPEILREALEKIKKNDSTIARTAHIPDGATSVAEVAASLPPGAAAAYSRAVIGVLRARSSKIDEDLVKTGIELIPSPYPGLLRFAGWRNILGILLAAAFLSLGAPFWYNALKNLTNLRSVLAARQQQESSED